MESRKPRKTRSVTRIIRIPPEYFDAIDVGKNIFPDLFQLENGLRLAINNFLTQCYGKEWWQLTLQEKLPNIAAYAEKQRTKQDSMPWLGASTNIEVLPIHLVTLGHLEEIVKTYQSECIPQLFPSLVFFLGHMEVIKRVRNMFSHMFPCITRVDSVVARREIRTLALHINARIA